MPAAPERNAVPWVVSPEGVPTDRRQRRRAQRVGDILAAAAAVLAEQGYANTSLDEIGERLDLGKASLYHYFKSKEELASAALQACADYTQRRLIEAAAIEGTPTERLRELIKTGIELMLHETPLIGKLFVNSHDWPPETKNAVLGWRLRNEDVYRKVIAEAAAAGEIEPLDPGLSRLCMIGALLFVPEWFREDRGEITSDLTDTLMRLFLPITENRPAMRRASSRTASVARPATRGRRKAG